MIYNIDNIPKLDKKRGEDITYTEINELAIDVYNKFNQLHSENVIEVDTGKWCQYVDGSLLESADTYTLYPNYCCWGAKGYSGVSGVLFLIRSSDTIDVQLQNYNSDLDDLINKINGA